MKEPLKIEECLVEKARKECECQECKKRRYWERQVLFWETANEIMQIYRNSIKDSQSTSGEKQ